MFISLTRPFRELHLKLTYTPSTGPVSRYLKIFVKGMKCMFYVQKHSTKAQGNFNFPFLWYRSLILSQAEGNCSVQDKLDLFHSFQSDSYAFFCGLFSVFSLNLMQIIHSIMF